MHRFLRSVGFRTYIKKRDIEKMLSELEKTALRRRIEIDTDENLCELRAELAPGMGIVLVGRWMNRNIPSGVLLSLSAQQRYIIKSRMLHSKHTEKGNLCRPSG